MNRAELGPREFSRATAGKGLAATGRVREASPVLADGVERFIFADVFSRSGLGSREREMLTCAVLATIGGADNQLGVHVPAALECGADPDELIQLCEQIVPYCGFPRALNALRAVRAVLEERGLPLPLPAREVALPDGAGTLVTDAGEGDDGLLMLHSPALDRQAWRELIRALPDGTRAVAPDLRGAGAAGAAPPAAGRDALVADLLAVADGAGLRTARLVAMGDAAASLAAAAAAAHPDRLRLGAALGPADPAGDPPGTDALAAWFTPAQLAASAWPVRYARDRLERVHPDAHRALRSAMRGGAAAGDGAAAGSPHPLADPAACAALVAGGDG